MTSPGGLQTRDLHFWWGKRHALNAVSIDVPKATFCALLGPNGAGKSTLFGLLCGLYRAREGHVTIAGHELRREPLKALASLGIVFQQPSTDLNLTVMQNLLYAAALHGLSGATARKAAGDALERLAMAERAHEKAATLNGGHRRRLEIARALVHRPPVLLLDEPTVGLDPEARQGITRHLHRLAEEGLSVLWATHLTDEVDMADQLVVLHKGAVVASGRADEIAGDRSLKAAFLTLTDAEQEGVA